ncbi:MAG: hypothetical protein H7836_00175 [Magnetococcus sp. YQC-3]
MAGQRVNFYHDRFRPQRPFLPLRTLVLYGSTLLALLLLITLLLQGHLAAREAEWANRLAESQPLATESGEQLRGCQTAWRSLSATEFRLQASFGAALLEQFATVHRAGIQLQRVELSQEGDRMLVQGHATPRMVAALPQYLQTLAQQPLLAGRDIQDLQLEKEPSPLGRTAPVRAGENGPAGLKFRFQIGKESKRP